MGAARPTGSQTASESGALAAESCTRLTAVSFLPHEHYDLRAKVATVSDEMGLKHEMGCELNDTRDFVYSTLLMMMITIMGGAFDIRGRQETTVVLMIQ